MMVPLAVTERVNNLLIAVIVVGLAVVSGEIAAILYFERRISYFEDILRSFFEKPDDKEQSPAGELLAIVSKKFISDFLNSLLSSPNADTPSLLDSIAIKLGTGISTEVKMTLMGLKSGVSRALQSEALDQTQEVISEGNPALGAMAGLLGRRSRSKWLPLIQFLAGMNHGESSNRRNNGESGAKVNFKL